MPLSNPHRFDPCQIIELRSLTTGRRRTQRTSLRFAFALFLAIAVVEVRGEETAPRDAPAVALQNAILKTVATVNVAAETKGVLQEVPIDIGNTVSPGDRLAVIKDDEIRIRLGRAQLELALAQHKSQSEIDILVTTKSAAVAENEYRRAIEANRAVPNTYPPNEIDRLNLVYERSELEVRRAREQQAQLAVQTQLAQNQVDEIENLLRKHTITAPIEGVVVSIEPHAGEWVEPGAPIATIVNLKRLRVEGFVKATEAPGVQIGDRADVEVQQDEVIKRVEGRVVFVSPDVNSVSDLVRVYVDVDNRQGDLRPGLRTTVSIRGQDE